MFDRFLIAPFNTGLETDLKPWIIPDDAFQLLENAYVFRGRVRKRFGSQFTGTGWSSAFTQPLFSRLRIQLSGTTDGSGNFSATVPGNTFNIGQQFSVGNQIFTVHQATGSMFASAGTGTGTFNTTTGALVISGAAHNANVYYYTGLPVMGITQFENDQINNEPSIAFDPQFAYIYSSGSWNQFGPGTGSQWNGGDDDFFWAANWSGITPNQNVLFVSNFFANFNTSSFDPIWAYSPSFGGNHWINYTPFTITLGDGSFIQTARIIVAFKDRLLLLNTIEKNGTSGTFSQFVNRCRYSINGSPFAETTSGADNAPYAFLETGQTYTSGAATSIGKGAGFLDATTDEQIISAEFIKDRLIVYFEKSTWELVYTGNQILPFRFQKINTELGSDATFSVVPFDKEVLAIGSVGVHSCNGANVERIDQKIPDEIFDINEEPTGVTRVAGVRDYFVEAVYWAYPNNESTKFPNKVLLYNYRNGTWALNDDSITTFGYWDQQTDTTWASTTLTWAQSNFSWTSGVIENNFRQVIAGNQQGYIFTIAADVSRNAPVLSITNMAQSGRLITLTIINHNLAAAQDYITIENLAGVTITDISGNNPSIFLVNSVVDANTITIGSNDFPLTITGTYSGGAVSARVSNINILSKQWNPYVGKGRNFYLARIDFCVDKTSQGQVTVDYYPSGSYYSMLMAGNGGEHGTQANMGNGVLETSPYDPTLYPFEQVQQRLWHPIYFQSDGQTIQIRIYMSLPQIVNPQIAFEDFVLEGLVLHTQPTSYRLQ